VDALRRRCAWSPSMLTCGTFPAMTSLTPSVEALSWTASALRLVAILYGGTVCQDSF
jgi:hypothetical protein